ncbi:antibiotic biosynthesis monooxygenase [Croceimicrobium sp.]|uniref:antibiotic biosynthesis monooxygenase n=1 Tax=Croceimicrobium sp. TaxID=2828340 RepID=UPI003BAD5544
MYCLVYRFEIEPNSEAQFLEAWEALTLLFREHCGGLGSRIHRDARDHFFAYAQWTDQETRERASELLPSSAQAWREQMAESCTKIETVFEGELEIDLLV